MREDCEKYWNSGLSFGCTIWWFTWHCQKCQQLLLSWATQTYSVEWFGDGFRQNKSLSTAEEHTSWQTCWSCHWSAQLLWKKETQRLTIQLCWARDQLDTKGMKECDKLKTKIFKPRPQPQNCINISLIWTQLRKLVMYRWTALQYADIICLPFHYSASLPAYVMCFRVNHL